MPWKTIAAGTSTLASGDNSDPLNVLETFFWDSGAVSVTVVDAEDKPIFEPGPGETPVWEQVTVTGLFDDNVNVAEIEAAFSGYGFSISLCGNTCR